MDDFQRQAFSKPLPSTAKTPQEKKAFGASRLEGNVGGTIKALLMVDCTKRAFESFGRPCWWVQSAWVDKTTGRPISFRHQEDDLPRRNFLKRHGRDILKGVGQGDHANDACHVKESVVHVERPLTDDELRRLDTSKVRQEIQAKGGWTDEAPVGALGA